MSAPGDPSRCAFTQYARVSPRTVGALDRHPEPHLLREGLRGVDLLDRDDAVALADVVERLAEPLGVEHRVERRRNGSVCTERNATAASDRKKSEGAPSTGVDMTEGRAAGALEGWRVLEVADGVAAAFCAKVLGDLGADVVKVEPPGGPRRRGGGVRAATDAARDEPGGRFLYLNTGKASVVVPTVPTACSGSPNCVGQCDVVVTDRPRRPRIARRDPAETTIVVAITPVRVDGAVRHVPRPPSRRRSTPVAKDRSCRAARAGSTSRSGRRSRSAATSPSTTPGGTRPSPCSRPATTGSGPVAGSASTCRSRSPSSR